MLIAIMIPVYNHLSLTQQMLNDLSLKLQDMDSFQCIVIDDGSIDGTFEWVTNNHPQVHLLKGDGNLWWSGAMNLGSKYAIEILKADYILLWNNDILFEKEYFEKVLRVVGEYGDDTIIGSHIYVAGKPEVSWSKGGYFDPVTGKHGMYGYFKKDNSCDNQISEVDWLTGMGSIIPCNIIKELKYWDDVNFPQYFGDSEFTYRAKLKGYRIIVHPDLIIYNRVENSGLEHSGSFILLWKSMTDNRSKMNFKRNFKFYQLYSKSYRAFLRLLLKYTMVFGGFLKWKILSVFSIHKKAKY